VSEPKKPAGRDISDLKARLGLKKGADGGPRTAAMPAQGVPPPTAAKIGGFVPPPPGVAPPPGAVPPQPVIPDASVDPFGAMSAMAAASKVSAAPAQEFVIVNDGKGVEQVHSGGVVNKLKYAALIFAPLIVGYIGGGVLAGNKDWNTSVDHAKLLYDNFGVVGKSLTDLQSTLDAAKDRGKGDFLLGDKKLIDDLEALKLQAPDKTILFHASIRDLDAGEVEKIFKFYTDLTTLYAKVDEFKRAAKSDERKATPKPMGNYAVVLRMPPADQKDAPPVAELVEVGAPICKGDTKINPNGCTETAPPEKFQVRNDPQSPAWQILTLAARPEGVAADAILYLSGSKVQTAFMVGADNFVDAVAYRKRITEIDTLTRELSETRGQIQTILNAEAQRGKRFAL
jgi:hypothetical protein